MTPIDRAGQLLDRAAAPVARATPLILRLSAGLLWLSNVSWKRPPDFGQTGERCAGLCGFVEHGINHPVAPGYPAVLENVVQPNLTAFGWSVLLLEFLLAALLLSGVLTRGAALVGMVQSAAIGLSVANADGEWYWSYILMVLLHLAVFAHPSGPPSARLQGRLTVAALTAGYGALLVVANWRNAWLTNDFTTRGDFLVFGGDSGFPGDFGRNVFAGSVVLGLVFVGVAAVVWWVAGTRWARPAGAAAGTVAVLLVATYRDDGNLLAAKPSAAAVLLAVGLYLWTTSASRRR